MSTWHGISKPDVALKLEPIQSKHSQLSHKHSVYKALHDTVGIPSMHWYGREAQYNMLILDHLGLTVEEVISNGHCGNINLVFHMPIKWCSSPCSTIPNI